jgi:SAM-dependent methyltransferase
MRIPQPLHTTLRLLRTIGLWSAEPFDLVHRRLIGQSGLPPLWLRRHVGPLAGFERAAGEVAATIALLELVQHDSTVLDLGCGVGGLVPDFQRFLGAEGRYVGFDVHRQSIEWCRRRFGDDARLRFELAELRTAYSNDFSNVAAAYRFPCDSATIDFALAKSLFTHLVEVEAEHYLRELARVLASTGSALVSVFLLDAESRGSSSRAYQFPYGGDRVRWRIHGRPAAGVAYRRHVFTELIGRAGLRVTRSIDGYWRGGPVIAPNAQDLLVISKL